MEIDGILVRLDISIHAPREGCDSGWIAALVAQMGISIHAPREGCDPIRALIFSSRSRFQSTHPARGATDVLYLRDDAPGISIHAPREGCDTRSM